MLVSAGVLVALPQASYGMIVSNGGGGSNIPQTVASGGQYFPIDPVKVLDTRIGLGEPTTQAGSLTPGETISDIPILGVGNIPEDGVESVFINLQVISTTGSGFISDYPSNTSNTRLPNLSIERNEGASGSDIVSVAPDGASGAGTISITNNSSGTIVAAAQVEGFFSSAALGVQGDSYDGLPWTDLVDTRSGLGESGGAAPLGIGQSVSFDPLGYGGVSSSDVDAVEFEVGALGASADGYLIFSGGDGTTGLRSLNYTADQKNRLTDVLPLNGNDEITITNESSTTVNVQVVLRGYFLNPESADVAGTTFQSMSPSTICNTASGCTFNGSTLTGTLSANGALTVQESGVGGVPLYNVEEVANEVTVLNPTATGWITVDPANTTSPTTYPAVNFLGGDVNDTAFDDTIVSRVSAAGAITITNHSSGTIDLLISADGYWNSATVPGSPTEVETTYDGTYVGATWGDVLSDGGAPVTSYNVYDNGALVATTEFGNNSSTFAANDSDEISVSAVNSVGNGTQSNPVSADPTTAVSSAVATDLSDQPALPAGDSLPSVWSGQITDGSGNPVAAEVDAYAVAPDPGIESLSSLYIGSSYTDSDGNFNVIAEPTSTLDQVMDVDGYFTVELNVTTSTGLFTFERQMQIGVSGLSEPLGADNDVLTTDGLATLGLASWTTTDPNALQNGSVLTVASGQAPESTDTDDQVPAMGPSAESLAAFTAGTEVEPYVQNSASQDPSNVCFYDGWIAQAPKTDAGDLPANPSTDNSDSTNSMPYWTPVIVNEVGLKYSGKWTTELTQGTSKDVTISTETEVNLGVGPLQISKSNMASSSNAISVGGRTPYIVSNPSHDDEADAWVDLHPQNLREHCYTFSYGEDVESAAWPVYNSENPDDPCWGWCQSSVNREPLSLILLQLWNRITNQKQRAQVYDSEPLTYGYTLKYATDKGSLEESGTGYQVNSNLFPSTDCPATGGGFDVTGNGFSLTLSQYVSKYSTSNGYNFSANLQTGVTAGVISTSLLNFSAGSTHDTSVQNTTYQAITMTNDTSGTQYVCPTIGPDASSALAGNLTDIQKGDGGFVLNGTSS
jgi:hypothetical protein